MAGADRPGEASERFLASAAFPVRRQGVARARYLVINQFEATDANEGPLVLRMSPRADVPHAQQGRVQSQLRLLRSMLEITAKTRVAPVPGQFGVPLRG